MSINIECMDQKSAKHIVGGLLGKNTSVFQIDGDDCVEVKRWLEEQTIGMDWVAWVNASQLEAVYLSFAHVENNEQDVREVNDAYMLFKMAWMSRENVQWRDANYIKCTLRNWDNSLNAA